jgi:hypothetical protein
MTVVSRALSIIVGAQVTLAIQVALLSLQKILALSPTAKLPRENKIAEVPLGKDIE